MWARCGRRCARPGGLPRAVVEPPSRRVEGSAARRWSVGSSEVWPPGRLVGTGAGSSTGLLTRRSRPSAPGHRPIEGWRGSESAPRCCHHGHHVTARAADVGRCREPLVTAAVTSPCAGSRMVTALDSESQHTWAAIVRGVVEHGGGGRASLRRRRVVQVGGRAGQQAGRRRGRRRSSRDTHRAPTTCRHAYAPGVRGRRGVRRP
jgi:hypothetical protein